MADHAYGCVRQRFVGAFEKGMMVLDVTITSLVIVRTSGILSRVVNGWPFVFRVPIIGLPRLFLQIIPKHHIIHHSCVTLDYKS